MKMLMPRLLISFLLVIGSAFLFASDGGLDKKAWGIYSSDYEKVFEETMKEFKIPMVYSKTSDENRILKKRRLESWAISIRDFFLKVVRDGHTIDVVRMVNEEVTKKVPRNFLGISLGRRTVKVMEAKPHAYKEDGRKIVHAYYAEKNLLFLRDGRAKDSKDDGFNPSLLWEAYFLTSPDCKGMKNLEAGDDSVAYLNQEYKCRQQQFNIANLETDLFPYLEKMKAALGSSFAEALGLGDPRLFLKFCEHFPEVFCSQDMQCLENKITFELEMQYLSLLSFLVANGLSVKGVQNRTPLAYFVNKVQQFSNKGQRYLPLIALIIENDDPVRAVAFTKKQTKRCLVLDGRKCYQYKKSPLFFAHDKVEQSAAFNLFSIVYDEKILNIIGAKYLAKPSEVDKSFLLSLFLETKYWENPTFRENVSYLLKRLKTDVIRALSQYRLNAADAARFKAFHPENIQLAGLTLVSTCVLLTAFTEESIITFKQMLQALLVDATVDPTQQNADGSTPYSFGKAYLQSVQKPFFSGPDLYIDLKAALELVKTYQSYIPSDGSTYEVIVEPVVIESKKEEEEVKSELIAIEPESSSDPDLEQDLLTSSDDPPPESSSEAPDEEMVADEEVSEDPVVEEVVKKEPVVETPPAAKPSRPVKLSTTELLRKYRQGENL